MDNYYPLIIIILLQVK